MPSTKRQTAPRRGGHSLSAPAPCIPVAHKTIARTGASGDGSLTKMTTATGDTLNYTYDALKRLNNVTTKNASGTALFSTSYAFKNLSTTNGITQTTTQVQYRNVRIGTNGTILEGKKYSYDDVGNITKISQSTSPYNPLVAYEYDSQNQLTKETYYDGAGSATGNITKTIAYTYDTAGNILSETKTVGTTTTTKNYTYGNTQWRDLLTKVGNTTISYDGGNPTNWYNGSKTYTGLTWQQGRQLAGLTVDGTSVSYEYDVDGIRTKMVAGDVTYEFVTQGGKLMRETAINSSAVYVMDFIYDNVGRPFAVKFSKNGGSSFTTFYYVLNLQGDVVAITKADGTVVAKYTYDAWGNLTSLINANGTEIVNRTTGTAIAFWNPLTYRGYIRDRETGWYYLQSRYYDPANHRFINADSYASTGQGFIGTNMFAYCRNDPVFRVDQTGNYDRDAAVEYADEWNDDANTDEYEFFGGRGGDCANFVSQCLKAGGIEENDGWHCERHAGWSWALILFNLITTGTIYTWDYSDSWLYADKHFSFFSDQKNGYINGLPIKMTEKSDLGSVIENYNIQKGDLLYFCNSKGEVYHATIISNVDSSMIYYAAHSAPNFDKPLSSFTVYNVIVVRICDDA